MSTAGPVRVDLHTKVLNSRVVARAKATGLDALVYAPHFTRLPDIQRRAERFTDDDLLVIPGREVFTGTWTDRKHVLAVGLTDPIPDYITLSGAMNELARQDAIVLVPHPTFATVSFSQTDIDRYRDQIHAIETYNPKHFAFHNRQARALSEQFDLPAFASSYAHLSRTVGEVWTTFPHCAPTTESILTALRTGDDRTIHHRDGLVHRLRCCLEFAHLFYENTLSKLTYSVFDARGTLPTHPLYNGRFDAVSAYGPP